MAQVIPLGAAKAPVFARHCAGWQISDGVAASAIPDRCLEHGPKEYRADIDGLRAIAVLAVVAYHAFPIVAPGGFVGVDVFFVISGYLITGLIVDGLKDGTFSFLDFYARRIKRIFPALLLVLASCL